MACLTAMWKTVRRMKACAGEQDQQSPELRTLAGLIEDQDAELFMILPRQCLGSLGTGRGLVLASTEGSCKAAPSLGPAVRLRSVTETVASPPTDRGLSIIVASLPF